jgi:hypothetical protein
MVQIVAEKVPEEAAQRGAPAIARGGRVGAVDLDVIEEGRDGVGVEVAKLQRGDIPAEALRRELEQQPHRIPVGANGVPARSALAGQILDEEGLDEREQLLRRGFGHGGGDAPRRCRSNRLLANSSSCGVALR